MTKKIEITPRELAKIQPFLEQQITFARRQLKIQEAVKNFGSRGPLYETIGENQGYVLDILRRAHLSQGAALEKAETNAQKGFNYWCEHALDIADLD